MQKYDIACVGAGMAGLAAAALLTKAGRTVCLMDPADNAGGCVAAHETAGFRFTPGPTMTYGFEPGGILQKLFSALDLSVNAAGSFPGYQVVMPEHRVTVSADPQETREELIREFPDEMNGLTRLYSEVHKFSDRSSKSRFYSYFLRQRTAAAYLQSFAFGRNIISYFEVQSRFFFGYSLQHMPLASLVLLLTRAPRYLPGGFTQLADQLLSIVQQKNGTWYHGEPFPELQFRSNRITGIRTSRGIIEAGTVLLNVSGDQAESTVFLGIRDEVVPVGMLPNVLCLAGDERFNDYSTLSLSPGDDRIAAPAGMRSLTAVFPSATTIDQSADSFVSRISPLVPFLQDFLVSSSIQDTHARNFPLPFQTNVKLSEYRAGRQMLSPCPVKNLKIIPDNVRALLPAVYTAQTMAEKLK